MKKKAETQIVIIIIIIVAAIAALVLFNRPGSILDLNTGGWSIVIDQDKINFEQGSQAYANVQMLWYDGSWNDAWIVGAGYYEFQGKLYQISKWEGKYGDDRAQFYKFVNQDIAVDTVNLEPGLYKVNLYVVAHNPNDIRSTTQPGSVAWNDCIDSIGKEITPDYIEKLNTCPNIKTRQSDSFAFNVVEQVTECNWWCRVSTWFNSLFI